MDIKDFFEQNPKVAIACSGGIDSAFLLFQATLFAEEVKAYFVKSAFQPEFEWKDAQKLCEQLNVELRVIKADVLGEQQIISNPQNRCYYCKKMIFGKMLKTAREDGYHILLEGTNASDDLNDRPGVKALKEFGIMSPLRDCGYTKKMIRDFAKQADLYLHDKPSYACLATRIPCGTEITKERLAKIEMSEKALFSLGFRDFRIRLYYDAARIQIREKDKELLCKKQKEIVNKLNIYFDEIFLDVKVSR